MLYGEIFQGSCIRLDLVFFNFSFFSTLAVCITGGQKPVNAGKQSKTLSYEDQVLKLVYEDGDPCPTDPALKHKSYFSFVCKSDAGDESRPVFVSFDEQTCTSYFSWHTSLACEEEVRTTFCRKHLWDLRFLRGVRYNGSIF